MAAGTGRARQLGAAALLGAAIATGQAPLGWWWLAVAALCGLTALIAQAPAPRAAARLGWIGGAGYFAAAMFWIVEPFLIDLPRHGWMAPFALVFTAFGLALFWALAAGAASWLGRGRAARALAFAFALTSVELLRGYLLTGFPWALLGHIWIDTPVAQAAAFVGPSGLSLIAALAAALVVLRPGAVGRASGALAAVALIGGLWALGAVRLAQPMPAAPDALWLRLIQPNAEQTVKWAADQAWANYDRQVALSVAPSERTLDLVIWPETAVPWTMESSGRTLELMAEAGAGTPLAFGVQRAEGARFFNSLVVLDAAGQMVAQYDKFHLVPFGEYIPYGDLLADFGISAFAAREGRGFSAGAGATVLDLGPLGQVQPLICYEAVFPQDLRAAPRRPDWLLQVTNDAWFGRVSGPYQHLAQARLRAIEQGLPLIRVANTGVTAVIDARGRVLQSLALGTEGFIDAGLPPALPPTLYARTGDGPLALLLALILGLWAVSRRILRRH